MAIINGRGRVGIRRPSAAAAPSIVLDGLKLYLDAGNATSYAGTGTVWTDISGSGNNGTLVGDPTYNSANSGSIVFDGVDDFVNLDRVTTYDFNQNNSFSFGGWFYITQADVNCPYIGKWGNNGSGNGSYHIWASGSGGNNVCFSVASGASTVATTPLKTYNFNKWNYFFAVYTSLSKLEFYLNNDSAVSVNYNGNINNPTNVNFRVAKFDYDGSNFTGRVSNVKIYNKALSATEVLQNYNALKSRFYPQVSDADAQAFIYAANIQNSTQANAVNTLVTSMKTAGVWTKMKAVYPMVGGSAASHKFNLKDPRDLDAAFRLTFGGTGWVHSSTGAKGNGTSDYANTFFNPSVSSNINSSHISYYARTGSNTNSVWVGSGYAGFLQSFGGTMYGSLSTGGWMASASSNYQFAMVNRTSSNYMELRKLGVSVTSSSNLAVGYDNSIYRLNSFGNAYYSPSECAFASIGDGLTNAEATSLYTAVQAFQTSLGRQV